MSINDVNGEAIVVIRSKHSPRVRVVFKNEGKCRVEQSLKEQCDINNVLKKYGKTGVLPINQMQAQYGDFTSVKSYQEALQTVIAANDAFESLPSKIRDRFQNRPDAFLEFISDENNRDEMIKLGLVVAQSSPASAAAPVAESASAASGAPSVTS